MKSRSGVTNAKMNRTPKIRYIGMNVQNFLNTPSKSIMRVSVKTGGNKDRTVTDLHIRAKYKTV